MDRLREFLNALKQQALAAGNFLGLLNVLIGRRITAPDGTPLSSGITWRELASILKQLRWDKEAVAELGLDPAQLPPRDRQRYWYTAITQAAVDSDKATKAGDALARRLEALGYTIGPPPRTSR